jgi:hypothetical protein
MRVRKNVYAFTAWRSLTDPEAKGVGWEVLGGNQAGCAGTIFLGGEQRGILHARLRRTADTVDASGD